MLPLILMLAGGGRTLEDSRVLRNDEVLGCLLQLEDMPSSDATGDWLRRMGAQELRASESETNGSAGLQRVNRSVFRRLVRQDDHESYTLDIDATQIVAEKRDAHYTYKGEKGTMRKCGASGDGVTNNEALMASPRWRHQGPPHTSSWSPGPAGAARS